MTDRLTNTEKATRYTAVFEFEGEAPAVHVNCGWLGGRLVAVSFCDELARIDFADAILAAAGEKEGFDDADMTGTVARLRREAEGYRQRIEFLRSRIADCERERDQVRNEFTAYVARAMDSGGKLDAEIDALKRRLEPLTEDEARQANAHLHGGMWATVQAIVEEADLIRARRA